MPKKETKKVEEKVEEKIEVKLEGHLSSKGRPLSLYQRSRGSK